MKTTVIIESENLISPELDCFNDDTRDDIIFVSVDQKNFLPQEIIPIIIELGNNIGYNAIYDTLKYIFLKLVNHFVIKKKKKATFEIDINGDKYSLTCDFTLTEEQKDKLIDTAIEKILND